MNKKTYYTEQMTLKLTKDDKLLILRRSKEHKLHPSTMVRIAALRQLKDEEYLDHQMRGKKLHRVFPEDADNA